MWYFSRFYFLDEAPYNGFYEEILKLWGKIEFWPKWGFVFKHFSLIFCIYSGKYVQDAHYYSVYRLQYNTGRYKGQVVEKVKRREYQLMFKKNRIIIGLFYVINSQIGFDSYHLYKIRGPIKKNKRHRDRRFSCQQFN